MTSASRPGTTFIRPARGLRLLDFQELSQFRELLVFLALRDVQVRYKQTAIGVLWVILQPLFLVAAFWIFFGRLSGMGMAIGDVPYPLFALSGLLPWQYFARVLGDSGNSLVVNQRLITRVYFPRIIVPISAALAALIDLAIGLLLLVGAMAWYRIVPGSRILALPLPLLLLLLSSLGVGFWLAALNTEYRDVMYAMPFLIQFWMFVTPVAYPVTLVAEEHRWILGLNPMAGVTEAFRWCLFGSQVSIPLLATSVASGVTLFLSGVVWFRSRERSFADSLGG